jgi:hypothetical protein
MKRKIILFSIILVPAVLLLTVGGTVVGIRTTAEPEYQVIRRDGPFEVRKYSNYILAETFIDEATYRDAGNRAFRKLFNYISGQNTKREKIAMTAPVIAEASSGEKIAMTAPVVAEKNKEGWRYAFVLPLEYSMQTAPEPKDPSIVLREVEGRTVAVIRYSGSWGYKGYDQHCDKLKIWMEQENYKRLSEPRSAAYDPPWTLPSLRRNEVMIDMMLDQKI